MNLKKLGSLFGLGLLIGTCIAGHAQAASSPWQGDGEVRARLVSATEATGNTDALSLGLEVELAPSFHTYWRAPGEAGLPPTIDTAASENDTGNLKSLALFYPAPQRLTSMDMDSIGYQGHVLFPLKAVLRTPGKPLSLSASVQILICGTMCLPKHFDLSLALPAGPAGPAPEAQVIQAALDSVPAVPQKSPLRLTNVTRTDKMVTLSVTAPHPLAAADLFIETPHNVAFKRPSLAIDGKRATFTLAPDGALPEGVSVETEPLTLTFVAQGKNGAALTLEQTVDKTFVPAPEASPAIPLSFGAILLLALLGGLILNLTPCVLPVLSLKIMGIVRHGGGEKGPVRRSFLLTAAGILFSFAVLAGCLMGLKAAGHAIGWGIQFQHPAFLIFLCVVLTLFAANLLDLFEVMLPRFILDHLDPTSHPRLAGDFATGALATLMATPCSAPFLGTAVSFALAGSALHILVIFLALGVGLATPYLLVALFPSLATRLPRPGAWMVGLRHIMGGLLGLTVFWLLYVLLHQIAWQGALFVLSCLVAIMVTLALRHHGAGRWAPIVLTCFLIAPFFAPVRTPEAAPQTVGAAMWRPFDAAAIETYVKQGKTVFVNVTADWCLTCKANKRFIMGSDKVAAKLFRDDNVIAMQADWTRPSADITSFLKQHDRYGVPFDAVFGPGAPQGLVLPEILTPADILNGLRDAGRPKPCDTNTLAC